MLIDGLLPVTPKVASSSGEKSGHCSFAIVNRNACSTGKALALRGLKFCNSLFAPLWEQIIAVVLRWIWIFRQDNNKTSHVPD